MGTLQGYSSQKHRNFYSKCIVWIHCPSGSQIPLPAPFLSWEKAAAPGVGEIPELQANIPGKKSSELPPAGSRLSTPARREFLKLLKCLKLPAQPRAQTSAQFHPRAHWGISKPIPLKHHEQAEKGAPAPQPAPYWAIKINIHSAISDTSKAGNTVVEFMDKYPGFCSLVPTTAGQGSQLPRFHCSNIRVTMVML